MAIRQTFKKNNTRSRAKKICGQTRLRIPAASFFIVNQLIKGQKRWTLGTSFLAEKLSQKIDKNKDHFTKTIIVSYNIN